MQDRASCYLKLTPEGGETKEYIKSFLSSSFIRFPVHLSTSFSSFEPRLDPLTNRCIRFLEGYIKVCFKFVSEFVNAETSL